MNTLISLKIFGTTTRYSATREVATKNNDFWNEICFNAIVEDFLQSAEGFWAVQPNIRYEEKIKVREFLFNSDSVLGLDSRQISINTIINTIDTYIFDQCCCAFTQEVDVTVYGTERMSDTQSKLNISSPRGVSAFTWRVPNCNYNKICLVGVVTLY